MSAFRGKIRNKGLDKKINKFTKILARKIANQQALEEAGKEGFKKYEEILKELEDGTEISKTDKDN